MNFQLGPVYEAKKYEEKIYKKWEKFKAFRAKVDKKKKPFSIAMPPPNATGTLHLGHATRITMEDILIRYHRMLGESALWLPGTDHAAIATQSVVEKKLQKEGIAHPRKQLGREKLLAEIKKFVIQSQSTIRNQLRKMGASCDWSREKYTLDDDMNLAVNTLFERMYKDGLIYRGGRMVNWDPKMQTTVADDELEYIEEKSKFYYFKYGPVVIGTARPETKFLDKIIVVNPKDKRYRKFIGKEFVVEWIDGPVKASVIADECVDMNLGTGAMTITPAHSLVDFELSLKYNLTTPQIIDFEGKIRKEASSEFGGQPISEAREKIVEKLKMKGLLVRIDENYIHNVAVNYRGKGIIEPQIMKQWFIDVNKKSISWSSKKCSIKDILQTTVKKGMIEIVPNRFNKTYFHWINNLKDWCISRQIWWGHQIPIWHKVTAEQYKNLSSKNDVSSLDLELQNVNSEIIFGIKHPKNGLWFRDPDTLDTWFSSALWTFATLGWPKKTSDLKYFHPTSILETGYDILFFWVARMILASTYALRSDKLPESKCIPFKKVFLNGLIRDRHGKKMSKSHPETCIDPLDMIEKYGTDALRLSLVIGSSPGNDMSLYEEKIAGYRNFINKIWNASRFALMDLNKDDLRIKFNKKMAKTLADKWIITKLQKLIIAVNKNLENFKFSDAGTQIYEFIWRDYCDWYLEISKSDNKNSAVLLYVLKTFLKLLHPFVPFVTENIWSHLSHTLLITESWPKYDKSLIFTKECSQMELVHEIITKIRSIRSELKVEPVKKIRVIAYAGKHLSYLQEKQEVIIQLSRLESLELKENGPKLKNSKTAVVNGIILILPLDGLIDLEKEKDRLKKEILNRQKFISSLRNKLSNEAFIENAPAEVIKRDQQRLLDENSNLEKMEEILANL